VIEKLPTNTIRLLGKRFQSGIDLSGGEWQKVAIARAYMRDAQLLILDEPTAALDARSEFEVFKRFKELSEGRTAVLISHRFSSVRMADRIVVLKDGTRRTPRARTTSRSPRTACTGYRALRDAGGRVTG
jgi:ATP-binding cassette subfamily B protein